MFGDWATKGLQVGLAVIVVVVMLQKFSPKAAIGALILMVIALGLYNSRNDLADMFEDEVANPAQGAPAHPSPRRTVRPPDLTRSDSTGDGL
ncbi:hypothetical protein [Streptomyces cadmiisoli]